MADFIFTVFACIGSLTVGTFAGALILGGKIIIRIGSGKENNQDE